MVIPESGGTAKVVETIVNRDPFLPPFTSLLVGEMKDTLEEDGEGYVVLLNKFALIHGHFLLVTKGNPPYFNAHTICGRLYLTSNSEYQSQSHPLTPSQLVQTYLLLLAAQSRHKQYFAFFNCGNLSGASQPHKHVQFIPGEPPIDRVAKLARVENEGSFPHFFNPSDIPNFLCIVYDSSRICPSQAPFRSPHQTSRPYGYAIILFSD